MTSDTILRAREMLADSTPLKRDCGKLCGGACCRPDDEGRGGMLLFPGEQEVYTPAPGWATMEPSDFIVAGKPLTLLTCEGECPRENRPLACRLFPLTPIAAGDSVSIWLDTRAWAVCPLMEQGMQALNPAFVKACEDAAALLWQDGECRAYIRALTGYLEEMTKWG